jgi:transcription termination/antitermination protein NusA
MIVQARLAAGWITEEDLVKQQEEEQEQDETIEVAEGADQDA